MMGSRQARTAAEARVRLLIHAAEPDVDSYTDAIASVNSSISDDRSDGCVSDDGVALRGGS